MRNGANPKSHRSCLRRLADGLVGAAAHAVPASHQHWAIAMVNETAYVTSDVAALRWSFGCFLAACALRLRSLHLLDFVAVRVAVALLAAFRAVDVGLPTLLALAYGGRSAALDTIGGLTPGDDYRRLVPLIEAIPLWLHLMLAMGMICYALAVVSTLRQRSAAASFLLAGVVTEQASSILARPILAHVGIVVAPDASALAVVWLPIVIPLLFAVAAWSGSRREALSRP